MWNNSQRNAPLRVNQVEICELYNLCIKLYNSFGLGL
jgi:hypothetical protein